MIRFDVDTDGLGPLLLLSDPAFYGRAVKAGLKNAARGVKTLAAKEIGAKYNLKAAAIKKDIDGPRFVAGDEAVEFGFSKRTKTISTYYGFTDRGKGLTGRVFRSAGLGRVQRGFIIASERSSAFALPWRRVNKTGRKPIEVVKGPSVASIALGEGRFSDDLQQAMGERALEQFGKGVENYLQRFGRG